VLADASTAHTVEGGRCSAADAVAVPGWRRPLRRQGHHLDHLIRHNAVGWPLTDQVNAFTISLVVYPVIAAGLLAYRAGRVGPGFWALISGGGAIFVSAVHLGPAAVEPPELILGGQAATGSTAWPARCSYSPLSWCARTVAV
jgi:hypothetical protein